MAAYITHMLKSDLQLRRQQGLLGDIGEVEQLAVETAHISAVSRLESGWWIACEEASGHHRHSGLRGRGLYTGRNGMCPSTELHARVRECSAMQWRAPHRADASRPSQSALMKRDLCTGFGRKARCWRPLQGSILHTRSVSAGRHNSPSSPIVRVGFRLECWPTVTPYQVDCPCEYMSPADP